MSLPTTPHNEADTLFRKPPMPYDQWLNSVNNLLFAQGIADPLPPTDAHCVFDYHCHYTPQKFVEEWLRERNWQEWAKKRLEPAQPPSPVTSSESSTSGTPRAVELFAAINNLLDGIDAEPDLMFKESIEPQLQRVRKLLNYFQS